MKYILTYSSDLEDNQIHIFYSEHKMMILVKALMLLQKHRIVKNSKAFLKVSFELKSI